jgi:hypothetical protein
MTDKVVPLVPTGYGYSLLDTVLFARSPDTYTRVMLVGKLSGPPQTAGTQGGKAQATSGGGGGGGAAQASALSDLSGVFASGMPAGVTGALFVLPLSWWAVVEGSPEEVVCLLRHLSSDAAAAAAAAVAALPGSAAPLGAAPSRYHAGGARVVAHVEDVPTRAFAGFHARKHSPPSDTTGLAALATECEETSPVAFATPVFHAIVEMGHALLRNSTEGSRALLGAGIEDSFGAALPSDERVQSLAGASEVSIACIYRFRKEGLACFFLTRTHTHIHTTTHNHAHALPTHKHPPTRTASYLGDLASSLL